jgi:hypothetical protein
MREHIKVFDNPPQYGRGIPSIYSIEIFDIPNTEVQKIELLLELLGFTEIQEVEKDEKSCLSNINGAAGGNRCIAAEFLVGGREENYNNFWDKKEKLEVEIDRFLVIH